jgi:hypothetical protein
MAFSGGPTCLTFLTPISPSTAVTANQKPVTIRYAQCRESPLPFQ